MEIAATFNPGHLHHGGRCARWSCTTSTMRVIGRGSAVVAPSGVVMIPPTVRSIRDYD